MDDTFLSLANREVEPVDSAARMGIILVDSGIGLRNQPAACTRYPEQAVHRPHSSHVLTITLKRGMLVSARGPLMLPIRAMPDIDVGVFYWAGTQHAGGATALTGPAPLVIGASGGR